MNKKLIEVALPLEAINKESAHEKSVPRRGHPATMHLWWARRPLAASRAVLFASLVDDPSSQPERFPTEEEQDTERQRLFDLIERLARWENSDDLATLAEARRAIAAATDGELPPVVDPFAGGGSIPLEARRLGLSGFASDLNPVAALISAAMLNYGPRFAHCPPVNAGTGPEQIQGTADWRGTAGLAADVRYYGELVRRAADLRVGSLYPEIDLPTEYGGRRTTVTAWLWARTIECSNPACRAELPLLRSFSISTKKGKEARVEPVLDRTTKTVAFELHRDAETPEDATKVGRGANFRCLFCGETSDAEYVKTQGMEKGYGQRLLGIIGEGKGRRRVYIAATEEHEQTALAAKATWLPDTPLPDKALGFRIQPYGFRQHSDLFNSRQLAALTAFSDLIREQISGIRDAALERGLPDDNIALEDGGEGARAYAETVGIFLAFALSKLADWCNTFCTFISSEQQVGHLFTEQKISMVWDYCETNPLSNSVGNFLNHVEWVSATVERLPTGPSTDVRQLDARRISTSAPSNCLVATDPPYYGNIGYADLSDVFYAWLRPTLSGTLPDLFSTVLTPKQQELIAAPHLFDGDEERAKRHFEEGIGDVFAQLRDLQHPGYPLTVVYGFRQSESSRDNGSGESIVASTGWETLLSALIKAGLEITGTWPVRSERGARSRALNSNALASSVVLVCRSRLGDAPLATRKDFVQALRSELPEALRKLQHGNIAPVDLAQASIGPGMSVFSRYGRVVEADGTPMPVRSALGLINKALDELLSEQEGDFDTETRWAVSWYEQFGLDDGPFGSAETLSKAKNTALNGLVSAGIVSSRGGKVRLLDRDELLKTWDPSTDTRLTVWEIVQHLVRILAVSGEVEAARIVRTVGGLADVARELAYRLYLVCERKGWSKEAAAYNGLVVAWPELARLASQPTTTTGPTQEQLKV